MVTSQFAYSFYWLDFDICNVATAEQPTILMQSPLRVQGIGSACNAE